LERFRFRLVVFEAGFSPIRIWAMKRIFSFLGFNKHSYTLLSIFLLTCFLIIYIWWPLVVDYLAYAPANTPWYYFIDWLLLGIFAFMSITIMARADLKTDGLIIFVGMCGGLVIESWGTQTNLWHYYTAERPPLWIIPAWPIASLSIDRITRSLDHIASRILESPGKSRKQRILWELLYWLIFGCFYLLMLWFVAPTFEKSYTIVSLLICAGLIFVNPDQRKSLLIFIAGSSLGYFLERWGTTRECWTYYTNQTPPLFAVLAHGMAAVAFWRAGLILLSIWEKIAMSSLIKRISSRNIEIEK